MWCRPLSLAVVVACCVSAAGQDDPVKAKLDAAKATYKADMDKFRAAVAKVLDQREEAARKDGDKKAVDQVKADRKAFADTGELPKGATALRGQAVTARTTLEAAFATAVKEYTKVKKDDLAAAAEKELEEFRKQAPYPKPAAKPAEPPDLLPVGSQWAGTWKQTRINGRDEVKTADVEMTVKTRDGKSFTGEVWSKKHTSGVVVAGTLDGGRITWKTVKLLTDDLPKDIVDNITFTGQITKDKITGTLTKPRTDRTYKAEQTMELKP